MKLDHLVALAPTLRLSTDRLVLRRMQEHDVATAIAHESDRSIMRWIRDPQPPEEIERRTRDLLKPWSGADGQWLVPVIADRVTDEMLGIVCCKVTMAELETMEIGYRLHPGVFRRGYATEACTALIDLLFGAIEVRKLVALCVIENEPSWRLMAKLGMQREARLREYSFLDGAWRDEIVAGLLRTEWLERRHAAG